MAPFDRIDLIQVFSAPAGGDLVRILWRCLMPVKLEWVGYRTVIKNCDHMLSRFHLIPERLGQTDGRTDGQTDGRTELLYQYRASVCWRAIKTGLSTCITSRPCFITVFMLWTDVRSRAIHAWSCSDGMLWWLGGVETMLITPFYRAIKVKVMVKVWTLVLL